MYMKTIFERIKKNYDCNNLLYNRLPAPVFTDAGDANIGYGFACTDCV